MSTRYKGVGQDRNSGKWYFKVDAPGADGNRRQVMRRGFVTAKLANDAMAVFRKEVADGYVPVPRADTCAGFAAAWIEALPAEGLASRTEQHYDDCLRRLLPTIGNIKIQELTALDLDRAYAAIIDRNSASSPRKSHVAVKKMLREAVRLGVVGRNVAEDARPPSTAAAKPKKFPTWTSDELARFLDASADDPHATLYHVAALTGVREGEMCELRWSDVDLDGATITVRSSAAISRKKGLHSKAVKTDASVRVVELDDDLVAVLKGHRKTQNEQRLATAHWTDHGLVFCEADGSQTRPDRLSDRWRDSVRKWAPVAGVRLVRFHDLRHGHATQMLAAGVRADIVCERLGHSDVAFTLRTYRHRYAGDQRAALAKLSAAGS